MGTRKRPEIETLSTQVALLRGINVAGQKRLPMEELRALARKLRFVEPKTYIQSGNLVLRSTLSPDATCTSLETAIRETFGFEVEVVVIAGYRWLALAESSPFPKAEEIRPKTLLLAVSKEGPSSKALDIVRQYAADERAELSGDALWIDFVGGSGRSKIRPAVLQRAIGKSATTRNWSTVQKLAAMVREVDAGAA